MSQQAHKSGQASSYAAAGVNIADADSIKTRIQTALASTLDGRTIGVGSFGSLFRMEGTGDTVLVSSCDGVGTKLKIAALLGRNQSVGHDIVNHCINDILCCGAMPLFFLDYIAMARLDAAQVADIVEGLAAACRDTGVALIGGETAEMPGFYTEGIYDLVGFIVGVVERRNVIDGRNIVPGDVLLGLPSSGLHTNGYSLARKVFGIDADPGRLRRTEASLGKTLGDALLEPHRPYHRVLAPFLPLIKGLAHITGGGFPGNVPRTLPAGLGARIDRSTWSVPPLFRLIQEEGNVDANEMYRVFNMGVGMVIVASPEASAELVRAIPGTYTIGSVIRHEHGERVIVE
ncbi:MAG: phosphoribosylformylglycinamidine cyclo-ligase [Dehalococcoidia bacterium]|jgi:phosphoribosylformylglycinamidine cyclo-ligase|nr:phosphoribosylformylglycinamidine cyclo-ligase [Dehalococcoidia bacterium]